MRYYTKDFWFRLPQQRLQLMAAGAGALPGGGGGGGTPATPPPAAAPPVSTPSPSSGPAAVVPGSSAAPGTEGTPAPSTTPNPNDPNIAILRQSHELVSKFGGSEKLGTVAQRYEQIYGSAKTLATQLGYTAESFEEAFASDPIDVVSHLRSEAAQAEDARNNGAPPDPAQAMSRELAPIKSHIARQMAREANQTVDSGFDNMLKTNTLFADKTVPAKLRSAVYNAFTDRVKWDKPLQQKILAGDDAAVGLQQHFDAALAGIVEGYHEYGSWVGNGGTNTPAPGGQPRTAAPASPGSKPSFSLDDILEGNDNATKAMPSLRNFR